jgi:hypothetical protein
MRLVIILFGAIAVMPPAAVAANQCDNAALSSAKPVSGSTRLSVGLSLPVATTNPTSAWSLLDATTTIATPLNNPFYRPSPGSGGRFSTRVEFTLPAGLAAGDEYIVTVANLLFAGCSKPAHVLSVVVDANTDADHQTLFSLSPSDDRYTSDLYLSGAVTGATGAKSAYIADAKVQLAWYIAHRASVRPVFDFAASTDPRSNSDSVLAGARIPITVSTRLALEPGFVIESDAGYHNVNWVVPVVAVIVPAIIGKSSGHAYIEPRVGLELGGNWRNVGGATYSDGILRSLVAAHAFVSVWHRTDKTVYLSVEGIDRLLAHSEPRFTEDATGLMLVETSQAARSYVKASVGFDFTKYVGAALKYEYGELPPVYTKVRNRFTISVVAKSKLAQHS